MDETLAFEKDLQTRGARVEVVEQQGAFPAFRAAVNELGNRFCVGAPRVRAHRNLLQLQSS